MKFVPYRTEYKRHFEDLNKAWLKKFFRVEPLDEELLSNPEESILKDGGKIFFAEYEGAIIGTVALIYMEPGVYELAKMAVDERYQGLGAGKFLCKNAIGEARSMNAEKLVLFTNSTLKPAIHIYEKFGFEQVPLKDSAFTRGDVRMELVLA